MNFTLFKRRKDNSGAINTASPEIRERTMDPHIIAREEYFTWLGSLSVERGKWRSIALVLLALCIFLIISTIYMAYFQVKLVPYIVQVDKMGYAIAVEAAPKTTPFETKVIISRLGGFIRDMRTIILDHNAQRRLITGIYTMIPSGSSSYMKINDYFRQNNPLQAAAKGQTQEVEIRSILHLDGNTWAVDWIEKLFEKGVLVRTQAWQGFISIALNPTRTLDNIIENPLGIYILDFNFSPNLNQDLKK